MTSATDTSPTRYFLLALVVLAISCWASVWSWRPPRPRKATSAFDAGAAAALLTRLLPVEKPHPIGSVANQEFRKRIVAHMDSLGLGVRIQKAVACTSRGYCKTVHNIIGQLPHPKADTAPVVLMAAHYDSVPAGPGIGDDAAGVVAVLEAARLLQKQVTASPIAVLLSDGEEAGLLGARSFVASDPMAKRIAAVVNVEARGTEGPSAMFQAVNVSLAHIQRMASALERPVTSSLFSLVYEKLPNDTDLTVFARAGIPGFNFAFFEKVENYHTPRDNRAHLSLASLQHHGDNVYLLTRALAEKPVDKSNTTAVWFDWMGQTVSYMNSSTARIVCSVTGLLWMLMLVPFRRRSRVSVARIGVDFLQLLAVFLAACLLAWGYLRLTHRAGDIRQWISQPWPHVAVLFSMSFAICMGSMWRSASRGWQRYVSLWTLWAVASVACGVWAPAVGHLFWLPTLAALVPLALVWYGHEDAPKTRRLGAFAGLLPLTIASLFWARLLHALVEVVTLLAYPVLVVVACILTFVLFPHVPGKQKTTASSSSDGLAEDKE